jgi:hypothetical protein
MAIKTSGNRRVQASSAIASGVVVIAKPDGSGYSLSGDGITANSVFSQQTVTPGSTSITTSIGSNSNSVSVTITATVVTTAAYSNLPDLAISTSGGYLRVLGTGFQSSSTVYINGILTATTFVSANEVRAQIPAASSGTATLFVSNTQGVGGLYPSGLRYYPYPVWTSTSSFVTNTTSTSIGFTATTAVSYTLSSGSLPGGLSLNSSTGVLSGTLASTTTTPYTFVISASNSYLQATTQTVTLAYSPLLQINFFVVAGGGGGGQSGGIYGQGGGGGAGGIVTGTVSVATGTTFAITVGGGGAINQYPGNPSTIAAPSITTITAVGGGGGGTGGPGTYSGASGGSGGGGNPYGPGVQPSQNFGNPAVQSQYGNPGGAGGSPASWGAGGGGAGGAGTAGSAPGSGATGGGPGYTWPYNAITYAAGGPNNNANWSGPTVPGTPGTNGRGNGGSGGAGYPAPGNGGSGGSGVVIIFVPTPNYPGAYGPQASNPGNAPGMTLITFTAPGTYTV